MCLFDKKHWQRIEFSKFDMAEQETSKRLTRQSRKLVNVWQLGPEL